VDLPLPFPDKACARPEGSGGGKATAPVTSVLLPCPRPLLHRLTRGGGQPLLHPARQPAIPLDLDAIRQRPDEEIPGQALRLRLPVKPPPEIMDRVPAKARKVRDTDGV
jgi:hypothetical protein